MMFDQSGRAQCVLTAIKAPDGESFDTFKLGKNVREMRTRMVESAELMSELPTATDKITVVEGYEAMRVFLEAAWERQGKDAEEIAFLLGGSRWADGSPVDPTIWADWLIAVRTATRAERER